MRSDFFSVVNQNEPSQKPCTSYDLVLLFIKWLICDFTSNVLFYLFTLQI